MTQDGGRHWSVRFSKHEANSQCALLTVSCAPGGSCVAMLEPDERRRHPGVLHGRGPLVDGLRTLHRAAPDRRPRGVLSVCGRLRRRGATAHLKGWVGPDQQRRRHLDDRDRSPRRSRVRRASRAALPRSVYCLRRPRKASGPSRRRPAARSGPSARTATPAPRWRTRCCASPRDRATSRATTSIPPGPLGGLLLTSTNSGIAWHRVAVPASSGGLAGIGVHRADDVRARRRRRRPGRPGAARRRGRRCRPSRPRSTATSPSPASRAPRRCAASPWAPVRPRRARARSPSPRPRAARTGACSRRCRRSARSDAWRALRPSGATPPAWRGARRATSEDVARSSDAGRTWRVLPHTATTGFLAGLACPTVATCDRGRTRPAPPHHRPRGEIGARSRLGGALATTSIACPTTRLCAVIGEPADGHQVAIWRSLDAGARWTLAQDLKSNSQGDQMACATARALPRVERTRHDGPDLAERRRREDLDCSRRSGADLPRSTRSPCSRVGLPRGRCLAARSTEVLQQRRWRPALRPRRCPAGRDVRLVQRVRVLARPRHAHQLRAPRGALSLRRARCALAPATPRPSGPTPSRAPRCTPGSASPRRRCPSCTWGMPSEPELSGRVPAEPAAEHRHGLDDEEEHGRRDAGEGDQRVQEEAVGEDGVVDREGQAREVRRAEDGRDERREQVVDEARDDRPERDAEDHRDGEVDRVATQRERSGTPSSLLQSDVPCLPPLGRPWRHREPVVGVEPTT